MLSRPYSRWCCGTEQGPGRERVATAPLGQPHTLSGPRLPLRPRGGSGAVAWRRGGRPVKYTHPARVGQARPAACNGRLMRRPESQSEPHAESTMAGFCPQLTGNKAPPATLSLSAAVVCEGCHLQCDTVTSRAKQLPRSDIARAFPLMGGIFNGPKLKKETTVAHTVVTHLVGLLMERSPSIAHSHIPRRFVLRHLFDQLPYRRNF